MPSVYDASWFQNWANDVCIIVASGPSAKDAPLEVYRSAAKFIAVNNSWKLAPWSDVLLAADGNWWNRYKGAKNFAGLKVTLDFNAHREHGAHLLHFEKTKHNLRTDKAGFVGMGTHSGFYAVNLALLFKCKRIALVGFDMHLKNGLHWHGEHDKGFNNPNPPRVERWRKGMDAEAPALKAQGVTVINASPSSALRNYVKMSLSEAMESLTCQSLT